MFKFVCILAAGVSCVCFLLTGYLSAGSIRVNGGAGKVLAAAAAENEHNKSGAAGGWHAIIKLTFELLKARDFQRIVLTNFIHICRSIAHLNFAAIAVDLIVPRSLLSKGSWKMSVFYAACTLVPQVCDT